MMMTHTQKIAAALLDQLAEWDDIVDEALLHVAIESRVHPEPMVSEFFEAVKWCEREGWITGARNKLRGPQWMLTDKGRAQRNA